MMFSEKQVASKEMEPIQLLSLERHPMIDIIVHFYSCHSTHDVGVEEGLIHNSIPFSRNKHNKMHIFHPVCHSISNSSIMQQQYPAHNTQKSSKSNLNLMLTKNILSRLWSILSKLHLLTNKLCHLHQLITVGDIQFLSHGISDGVGKF